MEGARTGSAARETKCQTLTKSGGAAVRTPKLTSAGKEFVTSKTGASATGSKSGDEILRRCESDLYCDFSTVQHPSSVQLPLGFGPSEAHRRNSRPGTDSSSQCTVAGSQMTSASRENIFVKRRTHNGCQKRENVQSNPSQSFCSGFVSNRSVPPVGEK